MLTLAPLQIIGVVLVTAAAGVGSTLTVVTTGVPSIHPVSFGVTVKVTVIKLLLEFVSVPAMLPGNAWPVGDANAEPPVAPGLVLVTARSYPRFAGTNGTVGLVMPMFTLSPVQITGVVLVTAADGVGSTLTVLVIVV